MKRFGIVVPFVLAALGSTGPLGIAGAEPDVRRSADTTQTASPQATGPTLAQFEVSWERRPGGGAPTVGGWVQNNSAFRVSGVRLRVEALDAGHQRVGEIFTYAEGDVLPGGRTYFVAPTVPDATTYRIHVVSFGVVSQSD